MFDFFISFFYLIIIIPFTLLCIAPAKNHLRFKMPRTVVITAIAGIIISALMSFVKVHTSIDDSILYVPTLLFMFVIYHLLLRLHISQTVAIYMLASSFSSFLCIFSVIFDAKLNPESTLYNFSPQACIFLLVISTVFCGIAYYFFSKYGSFLVDNLPQHHIWWVATMISATLFFFSQRMVIHQYSTLHTNMVGIAYITSMIIMFILQILLCIIYYFIVNALHKMAEAEDRNRILEMQTKQFESLQRYIDHDARARHDFRQTIYTLNSLSSEGDYDSIREYLNRYIDTLPSKETTDYCSDSALNALLNHYAGRAANNNISADIQVLLPTDLQVDSIDLCSIVGNILENAINACNEIPDASPFIKLIISTEQGNEIYIAMTNTFSGNIRQKKGRYLSTHKGGNGIGLISIATTASAYGGTASFSHDKNLFYSDIMLKNKPKN